MDKRVEQRVDRRPPKALRSQRIEALTPLLAEMRAQRWTAHMVAERIGIPDKRFWAYTHGETRIPADFIAQVCAVVGLPADFITVPEPRDLYIQQAARRRTLSSQPATKPTTKPTTKPATKPARSKPAARAAKRNRRGSVSSSGASGGLSEQGGQSGQGGQGEQYVAAPPYLGVGRSDEFHTGMALLSGV